MTSRLHSWAWFQHRTGYGQVDLLRVRDRVSELYRPFDLRGGTGKYRHIDNPIGALKRAQSAIKALLCKEMEGHPSLHGGVPGRSTCTAAQEHVRRPCLVAIDISNYFPSVTNRAVYNFFSRRLGCAPDLAKCLTELTTHGGHLPHGSPTSTILANLINSSLCDVLLGIAETHGCSLSVYVDDIFYSGMEARACIAPTISALAKFGFHASRKKVRVMPQSREQVMLGLSVGHRITLPSATLEGIRSAIRTLQSDGVVQFHALERLRHQIAWIKSIDPGEGAHLVRLLAIAEETTLVLLDERHSKSPERHPCNLLNCRATRVQRPSTRGDRITLAATEQLS